MAMDDLKDPMLEVFEIYGFFGQGVKTGGRGGFLGS